MGRQKDEDGGRPSAGAAEDPPGWGDGRHEACEAGRPARAPHPVGGMEDLSQAEEEEAET